MTYNGGWQTCSIKGQTVNIVVFVGHMVSVATPQLYCVAPKRLQTICQQIDIAASNKTLFIKTGSRPDLAYRLWFAGPLSTRQLNDGDPTSLTSHWTSPDPLSSSSLSLPHWPPRESQHVPASGTFALWACDPLSVCLAQMSHASMSG